MARLRLPAPPSGVTGELGVWLRNLWTVVNGMPQVSYFSASTPNSVVTGMAGDLAINLAGNVASNSTLTRVWQMGGVPQVVKNTDWVVLRVAP